MKCKQCNKEYEAKRSTSAYCSPKCKQEFYRNRINAKSESVTLRDNKPVTVTDDGYSPKVKGGKCWCCGDKIHPALVCCGPCAWSGKAKEKRAGRYPPLMTDRTPDQMETDLHALKDTGYQMTDFERGHYKPASLLRPSEHNPVSKPGDSHYTGVADNHRTKREKVEL